MKKICIAILSAVISAGICAIGASAEGIISVSGSDGCLSAVKADIQGGKAFAAQYSADGILEAADISDDSLNFSGKLMLSDNTVVYLWDADSLKPLSREFVYKNGVISGFDFAGSFLPTFGQNSQISASVDGITEKALEWSKPEYSLNGSSEMTTAVIAADDSSNWGDAYFQVPVSAEGYYNISFSAKIGATKKGPKNYTLSYSTDGVSFTELSNYSLTKNKTMEQAFDKVDIPVSDCESLYIRISLTDNETVGGDVLSSNPSGGEFALAEVYVYGTTSPASEPSMTAGPTDTPVSTSEPLTPVPSQSPSSDGIIHLNGKSIDAGGIENVSAAGTTVTISAAGEYTIEGNLDDGQIIVDTPDKSDEVTLHMNSVSVSSSSSAPFFGKNGKIKIVFSGDNTFTDAAEYVYADGEDEPNACFFSKRDLTFTKNCTGTLTVISNYNNGIGCKADLKLNAGTFNVTAVNNGIKGNDTVTAGGADITVVSGGDGIKTDNPDEPDDGNGVAAVKGGTINITTTLDGDGIQADILLDITGGDITVNSIGDGLKCDTGVSISGGTVDITSQEDGVQAGNSEGTTTSYITVKNGDITINCAEDAFHSSTGAITVSDGIFSVTSGQDGFQAETDLSVSGGVFTIISGGGSSAQSTADISAKGLKGVGAVNILGGTFNINTLDDCVHSNGDTVISGGDLDISSGDDGIHSDVSLTIEGSPSINITKSYEGLEALTITINDGNIHLTASDDGINAAGGNDQSNVGRPGQGGFNPGGQQGPGGGVPGQETSGNGLIAINGGYIYIDASGDGIDANGNITMTGGTVIVNGPTSNGDGALDYDGSFTCSGGFLAAAGSSGMVQTPSSSSSLYCANITFRQSQRGMICIKDSSGNELLTFEPSKAYSSLVFVSPELVKGGVYTVFTGGSSSADQTDGLYSPGGYSGGTQKTQFTQNSIITNVSIN